MSDETVLREILGDLMADLLSFSSYSAFIKTLFAQPQTTWVDVIWVCDELGLKHSSFAQLEKELPSPLFATWLPLPEEDDTFFVVLFFVQDMLWSSTAIFNRNFAQ